MTLRSAGLNLGNRLLYCTCWAVLLGCAACDRGHKPAANANENANPRAADAHDHEHGHVHAAPHGGTIVELEPGLLNVEVLLDSERGQLTLWLFDGCLQNAVRSKQDAVELTVVTAPVGDKGESYFTLNLQPVANALTGERFGDTSQFTVQSDDLKGCLKFRGIISTLRAQDETFEDVSFEYPGAHSATHGDEQAGGKDAGHG